MANDGVYMYSAKTCLKSVWFYVGTVRLWHANTYRLESTLNYGLERVWTITMMKGSNNVALGYDEGSIIIKVGSSY